MMYQMIVNAVLQGIGSIMFSSTPDGNFLAFASKCRNKCAGSCPICPGFTVYQNFTCVYFQELTGIVEEPDAYSYLLLFNEDTGQCRAEALSVEEGRNIIEAAATEIPIVTIRNSTECECEWQLCSATHYYYCKVTDKVLSFDNAQRYCECAGGQLASIHSIEEVDYIQDFLGGSTAHWIGLYDVVPNKAQLSLDEIIEQQKKTENWVWIDGSPMDFENWIPGQPDACCGNTGSMAAIAQYTEESNLTWDDIPAYREKNFVCKREPKMVLVPIANATLNGTIYEAVHSAGDNFVEAASTCGDNCSAVYPICLGYTFFPNFTCVYFESIDDLVEDLTGSHSYIFISEEDVEQRLEKSLTIPEARELIGLLEDEEAEVEEDFTVVQPPEIPTIDQANNNQNVFTAEGVCRWGWMYCWTTKQLYCKGRLKKMFNEANKACERVEGLLTSVHSTAEVACIRDLLGSAVTHWIGLYDVVKNKNQKWWSTVVAEQKKLENWVWVDGSPMNFSSWQPGQPDGCGWPRKEDMAALAAYGNDNAMKWSDEGVEVIATYVCKKK